MQKPTDPKQTRPEDEGSLHGAVTPQHTTTDEPTAVPAGHHHAAIKPASTGVTTASPGGIVTKL